MTIAAFIPETVDLRLAAMHAEIANLELACMHQNRTDLQELKQRLYFLKWKTETLSIVYSIKNHTSP